MCKCLKGLTAFQLEHYVIYFILHNCFLKSVTPHSVLVYYRDKLLFIPM